MKQKLRILESIGFILKRSEIKDIKGGVKEIIPCKDDSDCAAVCSVGGYTPCGVGCHFYACYSCCTISTCTAEQKGTCVIWGGCFHHKRTAVPC